MRASAMPRIYLCPICLKTVDEDIDHVELIVVEWQFPSEEITYHDYERDYLIHYDCFQHIHNMLTHATSPLIKEE